MSQEPQKNDYRALLQQALVSLEQMETKLRAAERAQHEPVAIIGMGFRFPGGADDSASFWNLLKNGTDAITEVPPDRWDADQLYDPDPDAVGKMYTRWGGFLNHVDQFDPQFFGISPREAVSMDPQQRLLLETTWEALEGAGQASSKLSGSRTGVFVGMVGGDYANLKMISGGIHDVDAYFGTGNSRSIAAGRIAYTFGLHGPAVAVDTACSSSLVAAHQACQSLRLKECDMAVAGGVNLILEPSGSISTSRARMMSFDGKCKTFDVTADGYVRSEGCAMIVLKRLSDALKDGDNILAVIMGTATNQDGRSNGLTAPNGKAQEAVIRAALDDAQIKPADVSYVETHGTGTSLGDPIEVRALGGVFSEGRSKRENPLMIGSVKTNVGHLEAAAGIVGLVKVVLSLQNKTIPPHLHLNEPNPYIPWNDLPVTVPTSASEWKTPEGKPRVAGLSSFGFSGTNSHMIIAEAPVRKAQEVKFERTSQLFTISAKTESALRDSAKRLESYLEQNPTASLADVTYSLNTGRSHFPYRLAITTSSLQQTREKLSAWLHTGESNGVLTTRTEQTGKPEVVFLFTGQGAQYPGMARQLYESQPTFKKMMDKCDEILRPHLEKPLLSVIYPQNKDDENLIHQTVYTQPALFAIEYCLAKLWESWGVEPSVVLGHSVGEYVAACIAGVFTLEDGLKLIAARGRLMQSLPSGGAMVSVFAEEARVKEVIAPHQKKVSIAAVNGPNAIVISGAGSAIGSVVETLQKEGIKSQPLNVSHAFHSPLMDSILDEFETVAKSVQYHSPQIGLISNLDGRLLSDSSLNAKYWREHARHTVRFADGIKTLHEEGYRFFLEIGPNPTLLGMAKRCEPMDENATWLPSLRAGRGDWEQMLESLAQLYVHGQDVAWDSFEQDYKTQRRQLSLPTYPFQRERYWLDFEAVNLTSETKTDHPLLGSRLATAMPIFQKHLSASSPAYLNDHCIHNMVILPAAAYLEIALAAGRHSLHGTSFTLENISIHEALPLSQQDRTAQMILTTNADGASFQYFSREQSSQDNWRLHADGRITYSAADTLHDESSLAELKTRLSQPLPVDAYYQHLAAVGADYGPAFHGIQAIWHAEGEALGTIKLSESLEDVHKYAIHPALLDACFQLLGAAVPGAAEMDRPENQIIYVPVGIQSLHVVGAVGRSVHCHVRLHPAESSAKTLTGDLTIFDDEGKVVGVVNGLLLQQIDQQSLRRAVQVNVDEWLYEIDWMEQSKEKSQIQRDGSGSWLIFADEAEVSQNLVAKLKEKGETCHLVYPGAEFSRKESNQWIVDPLQLEHFKQLLGEIKQPLRGVVHLWSLQGEVNDQSTVDELHSIHARNHASVLHIVQSLAAQTENIPQLWLVTRNAYSAGQQNTLNPAASTFWGLGNLIALEQPDLNCVRIDMDTSSYNPSLFDEIWEPDGEEQIALRGNTRYVARLNHSPVNAQPQQNSQPVQLVIKERGVLDNLTLQPMSRRQPAAHEVEVEVRATGLNFRDVLNTLGMYPGDAGPLGSECSGIVTAVGSAVTDLKIGDPVIALITNCFSSYVNVPATLAIRKPESISFEEAATIPIAFLTADYALNTLAKMKAGDRVLIHAAAGGVGMAAVQLAQRAGAEIFGTAGSDEKRELLNKLGLQHVMNSRSLDFADEIMSVTNGEGVDIVLNSLAGEFIPKSISVLKESGAFVEIGKTDVWDEQRARELKKDIRYFVLYLGEVMEKDPLLIRKMLIDLLPDFENGTLKPLLQQTFALEKSVDAFRFMAQAKHVGKIVITQQQAEGIRPDATYLITGGLGGLGLVAARWLADQGARHVVLVGRSAPSEEAQHAIDEITAQGVTVHAAQADISKHDQVETVLGSIQKSMPALRGVIHAAGVLDDGILLEQTWTRFETVMAPKVDGAWNLHTLTHAMQLDFFVLFSAGAALLGSAGQSNYAAANSFLDGLAHYRRSLGLPALSINWGAWADVGMAARLGENRGRRWSGMESIKPADGMRAMHRLMERDSVQAGVLPINWRHAAREKDADVRPLLRLLIQSGPHTAETESSSQRISFTEQLKNIPVEEQYKFLFDHVRNEVNKVLGLDAAHSPNPRQGFTDIGLDSLMAVELSNRLQKSLERRLPTTLTFEYPTIEALTGYLASEVLGISIVEPEKGRQKADKPKEKAAAEVNEIPDDQVEDALLKELKDAGY